MKDFALLLRKKRAQEGSLIINKPEVYFIYDENKYPIEPRVKYQDLAEIIIEEFMIAGNIGFIETMIENGAPCIYSVEDEKNKKNQKKLDEFLKLLKALGNPFYYSSPQIIANRELLQGLVDHISNFGPLSMVLMTHFIKCMSHAYYSVENSGHYGIGKRNYGHTTSPDRRLSDDTNSRSADDCVLEQDPEKRKKSIHYWDSVLPDYARRATDMERVSETVERRVFDLETCMYFERHIGEEYDGTVVSFDDKDIHIILDNLLEGVVRCNTLTGKYTYNSDQYTLLSLDGEENYYLGDRLKLEVLYTDREYNIVYFKVLEKIDENFIEDKDDSNIRAKTLAKIKREEAFK